MFVDECGLNVHGGDGGAGCAAFRREAHVPRGGPDGGDGGGGGDVYLIANTNVASLLAFRDHPHRRAADGVHGQGKRKHGRTGASLEVAVAAGTVVRDKHGRILADLSSPGDRWLAAHGGRGGRGNARFLTNRRRAPSFAEQGEPGEQKWLKLELKLVADVALVGFPNVGKSTLISRVSAARPKVADYPFTTLEPHLGVVRVDDAEFVVADVPGVIEGAAEGKGLGHQFLRHIERSRVLLLLIDLAPTALAAPQDQEATLLDELAQHQPDLVDRPRLVVGSRADLATAPYDGRRLSAVTGEGVDALLYRLAGMVAEDRERSDEGPGHTTFVVHRPVADDLLVERIDGGFVVSGREVERAVAVSDLTNDDALEYVQNRLRSLGVDRALARAGAKSGDPVQVGPVAFDYEPEDDP